MVINVVEFITNGVVLADDWAATMRLAGRPTAPATGIYPLRLVTIVALVCLGQALVASEAGAWVYRE